MLNVNCEMLSLIIKKNNMFYHVFPKLFSKKYRIYSLMAHNVRIQWSSQTLRLIARRLAVELSLPILSTKVCHDWDSNSHLSACQANALTHCATVETCFFYIYHETRLIYNKLNYMIYLACLRKQFIYFPTIMFIPFQCVRLLVYRYSVLCRDISSLNRNVYLFQH